MSLEFKTGAGVRNERSSAQVFEGVQLSNRAPVVPLRHELPILTVETGMKLLVVEDDEPMHSYLPRERVRC